MFDYAHKMRLAVSDKGRRAGLKAAAGAVAVIAVGFLLAGLWSFLAHHLGWGSMAASLAIGVAFLVIAGIVFLLASRQRHPVPTSDELRREVEARLSLATEAALAMAVDRSRDIMGLAGERASSLMDEASDRASAFVGETEKKIRGFTRGSAGKAAEKVGLRQGVLDDARYFADDFASKRAMPAVTMLGAFAIGLTLASRLKASRRQAAEEFYEDDPELGEGDPWDDPWAAGGEFEDEYR